MPTEPQTPSGLAAEGSGEGSGDDRYLALLQRIEQHLGRIADVLEALSPGPSQLVKDLGPVRNALKPKDR